MKKIEELKQQSIWQWKAMEYFAYVAVFCIPLFVGNGHWFPFSTTKALLIHATTGIMLLLFGWGLWTQRQEHVSLRITPIHITLGIFLIILTIGAITGIDAHNSFFGVLSQSISLVLIYSAAVIACLIAFLICRDRATISKILTASFVASSIFSLIAYGGETLISASQTGSTLGNSSFAGAYLLFNICFGIGLLFWYKKYWQKVLVSTGLLITLFSSIFFNQDLFSGAISIADAFKNPLLFMGRANGAIIGVVVSVLVIVGLLVMRNGKRWSQIMGAALLVVALGGIFTTGIILSNPKSALHRAVIEQKTGNRFLFLDIARSGFVENPVLGNGFNNYIYTFQSHFKTEFYRPGFMVERWTNQPHNVLWEYLSTTGILGTISFLVLLTTIFLALYSRKECHDANDVLMIVLAGSLVGYFVQNLFVFDTPVTYLMLFLVAGIAMGISGRTWSVAFPNKFRITQIVSGIVMVGSIVAIVFLVIFPWKESKQWLKATNKNMIANEFDRLVGLQNISLMGGTADSAFLIDNFFSKYRQDVLRQAVANKSLESLVNVENFLEQELERQPNNFRARLVLGRIMIMHMFLDPKSSDVLWDRAYDHIQKARILNAQNPEPFFEMGHLYVIKGDFNRVRGWIRAGIAIAPEYVLGYDIAEQVNKLRPDARFMEYVRKMKMRHSILS